MRRSWRFLLGAAALVLDLGCGSGTRPVLTSSGWRNVEGSGGKIGAAGHPGTGGGPGGASGTGGAAGGGAGASGSSGQAGGRDGSAGAPVDGGDGGVNDGGESCQALENDYAAARAAAFTCTPGVANQCQQISSYALLGPTCFTCDFAVNDATTMNAIRAQWIAQGCAPPTDGPPVLVRCTTFCVEPGSGHCVPWDAEASGGFCEGLLVAPAAADSL